jgi:hypothetical protein
MTTAGELRTIIADVSDKEKYLCYLWQKSEADEKCLTYEDTPLTDDEWERVINHMNNDDGLWQSLYESFDYFIHRVVETRKKGENVSSS